MRFRTAELEDSSSEGDQYNGDYVLPDYLDAGLFATWRSWAATARMPSSAPKTNANYLPNRRHTTPRHNVLFFVEFGPGPRKFAAGRYREELRFTVPESPVISATVQVDGQTINIGPYDDLGFQATTRGGRVMDHVLANKAVFKGTTDAVGNAAIIGGAIAASSRDPNVAGSRPPD